ncbi:MAG: lysine--tRNA ligase [Candidatus Marsarchaeota archaeon]|jgi:lysyl-tRNA synthetase class 2|nr:lysine--tRNA ligase [Candidatus Marsarchaeota archaeon]
MVDSFKLDKMKKLLEKGINPYPYSFKQSAHAEEIKANYEKMEGTSVSVAGRAVSMRRMGQLYFIDILDESGKIQMLAAANITEKASFELLDEIDAGDILGIEGTVSKTKRGEISVEAKGITVLAKSLRQLPEKFHGLNDTELRYRKRYLDLIANTEVRKFFTTRAKVLSFLRNFLDSRGYVEFETPILQQTYGGANAEPFKTRYNALGTDVFLRISDELYLKRLIIGGFEKVYEVSKDFRNEDIDSTHNPEFTQIEFYEAYKDYNDFMEMTEEMLSKLVKELFGTTKIKYQGKELDFTPPFKRVYWVDEIKKKTGIDVAELTDEQAKEISKKEKLEIGIVNAYHVADALFDKYIKPELFNPAFVLDFPAYMCPLTKDKRGNPKLSERFELYLAGKEDANCYSELTDPIEQRKKFEEQDSERKKGDVEAPPSDEDFLEAIEYGMPPTAGLGIAIDRLAMILTDNVSIKEVMPFPAVKPKNEPTDQAAS